MESNSSTKIRPLSFLGRGEANRVEASLIWVRALPRDFASFADFSS